jgi:gliding motility-associated-like protein
LTATINATSVSCFGESDATATIQQSGGTPTYTYVWDNGQTTPIATGIAAGIFSCTVTDNNGCTTTSAFNIIEPQQLVATINPPFSICAGQTANLSSNVSGGTPSYNYNWSNGAITANTSVTPASNPANYNLVVTDANGCTTTALTTVSVNPLPDVTFSSDIIQGCGPLCVTFTNSTPNTVFTLWGLGNGASSQGNPDATNCYTTPGAYSVTLTVTDINGCVGTTQKVNYITVHPNPVASFTATPQPASILSPVVYFTDLSIGAISWTWSFGDVASSSSSIQNPNYVYPDTGNYAAQLVVTNEFGCKDSTYREIRINPDFVMYVPNTFTPNGDNINDIFIPVGIGMEGDYYEFLVYDRWGDVIFKSNSTNLGWNGKANGGVELAQQDTYVWRVSLRDVLGVKHLYVGNVNLIR